MIFSGTQIFEYTHTQGKSRLEYKGVNIPNITLFVVVKTWPTIDDAFGCIMMTAVRAPFSPSTMCALLMGKEAQTDQD